MELEVLAQVLGRAVQTLYSAPLHPQVVVAVALEMEARTLMVRMAVQVVVLDITQQLLEMAIHHP